MAGITAQHPLDRQADSSAAARSLRSPDDLLPPHQRPPAGSHDSRAWMTAVVTTHETRLTCYAARLMRGDAGRAQEVVQDVFLKLWAMVTNQPEGATIRLATADNAPEEAAPAAAPLSTTAWLYRVVRNRALDIHRKDRRMTATASDVMDVTAPAAHAAGRAKLPPSTELEAETNASLRIRLERLPARQQEALRLRFAGGLSYAQIAEVMDITVTHVGVMLHQAVKALRESTPDPLLPPS